MNAEQKPHKTSRQFRVTAECQGRLVAYTLEPTPTGVRVVRTSEHDALGGFAEASPCSRFRNQPNEYWSKITNWSISEIELVVSQMATQLRCHTGDWINELRQRYPPARFEILYHTLFRTLFDYPQGYTTQHIIEWEDDGLLASTRWLAIQLMACKGRRITPKLIATIEECIGLFELQQNDQIPITIASAVMHYAHTAQPIDDTLKRLWLTARCIELRQLTRSLATLCNFHPVARRHCEAVVAIADELFATSPLDIRTKWSEQRKLIMTKTK